MAKPANDNATIVHAGDQSIDIASTSAAFMSNLLRVMRYSGRPERVANDIKMLAKFVEESESAIGVEATGELICGGLRRWEDFHKLNGETAELSFLRAVLDNSLLGVASCLSGDEIRLRRAQIDIHAAAGRFVETQRERDYQRRLAAEMERAEAERSVAAATGSFVYFISNGSEIKIGKSVDPQKRIASLQTASPQRLKLLAAIPGDESDESRLHALFAEFRLNGEWFSDCNEIREYIAVATGSANLASAA